MSTSRPRIPAPGRHPMDTHRVARALASAVLTERCRCSWLIEDSYLAVMLADVAVDERLRGIAAPDRLAEAADDLVACGVLVWALPSPKRVNAWTGEAAVRWSDAAGLHRESDHKAAAR